MAPTKKASEQASSAKQRIVFFHPDLGIGGAERLIVDAAVGLQERGHKVTIFTSHCDPTHCFEEARDGTIDVRVRGNTIFPSSFLRRFHILLATLRQVHLVLQISVFSDELKDLKPTTFIVDQLSACLPLLRWLWPDQRTLFYCHFPDQLLARRDQGGVIGIIKGLYRMIFDWFEVWTMTAADSVVVNSKFTKSVVINTFGKGLGESARVLYPCVDTTHDIRQNSERIWDGTKILLSINRFEEKKGIELAIRAYHGLTEKERKQSRLVIAGGYDPRVPENVRYHKHLESLAESLGLKTATAKTVPTALAIPADISVVFLQSIPASLKDMLLASASLLLYTPQNEHFGIVPVEAMFAGVPVLAATTGGPLETVVDGKTGWSRDVDDVAAWTSILRKVLVEMSPQDLAQMGKDGRKRVEELFSRTVMARRFEEELQAIIASKTRPAIWEARDIFMALGVVAVFVAGLIATFVKGPARSGQKPTKS